MKNIDKKTQRILSFVPFVAFAGVGIYTYINFAKYKANFMRWFLFALVLASFGFATHCVNTFISSEQLLILKLIVQYAIGVGGSLLFVELQLTEHIEKDSFIPKNIKLIIIVLAIVLFGCVLCSSIVPFLADAIQNFNELSVEDTNGTEDYSLVKITRDELINNDKSSIFFYGEFKGGNSSMIDDLYLEDCDYDELTFDAGKFNGVTSVHATKTDKEVVRLDINVILEKGNAELAVIVDGEYYSNVAINQHNEIVVENAKNKTIVLKAAGESADIRIEVKRSYN